jgi:hypothetical protein
MLQWISERRAQRAAISWVRILQVVVIAGAALAVILLIGATALPTLAASSADTVVRISPAIVTTTTDFTTSVNIVISDVNRLYAADVRLTFDPALLAVQDANSSQSGVQIELGPMLTSGGYYLQSNAANNLSGTIVLVITQLNPALPVTGTGVLARVTFLSQQTAGASPIHFSSVGLADNLGGLISATAQDGSIVIQPAPAPPRAVQFSSSAFSANEKAHTALITTTLDSASALTVTVDYATRNGTAIAGVDYTAVSGTLMFRPGQTVKTFGVPITDDGVIEPNESVLIELSHPSAAVLGALNLSTLTIADSGMRVYLPFISKR